MKKIISKKAFTCGILTAVILTVISGLLFVAYNKRVREQAPDSAFEYRSRELSRSDLEWLAGFHYVLYKELYCTELTRQNKPAYVRYQDLFFEDLPPEDLAFIESPEEAKTETAGEAEGIWEDYGQLYRQAVQDIKSEVGFYLTNLQENQFERFNYLYDYWIRSTDKEAGDNIVLTNASYEKLANQDFSGYEFLYRITYDSYGVAGITELLCTGDVNEMRKNMNLVLQTNPVNRFADGIARIEDADYPQVVRDALRRATVMKHPADCEIIIGMTAEKWAQNRVDSMEVNTWEYYYGKFANPATNLVYWGLLLTAFLIGAVYLNPKDPEKRASRQIGRMSAEIVLPGSYLLLFGVELLYADLTRITLGIYDTMILVLILELLFYYLAAWYAGGCLGEMAAEGISGYFVKRSFLIKNWKGFRERVQGIIRSYREIRLDDELWKKLLGIVALNGVVVSLLCCFWFLGIVGVLFYSVILYYLLLRYLKKIQKQYSVMRQMTAELSAGNLKAQSQEEFGIFEPVREDLVKIRDSFDEAVQQEVRSQKMKTELITNVSHDLKTPLTAIITYIDLLKNEQLEEEQRRDYLDTLEKKSMRLKTLIEDLFEVSKANSGNVQMNFQNCDLVDLLKQAAFEIQDKLEERKLITRLLLPKEKVMLRMDSEKTYRIYENLFGNVAKYAMEGTRVYVELMQDEDTVSVVMKNITEAELSVSPEELTERFVRGDASRGSVEGSGLGLAIVRSFTELQGGRLDIQVDGDLFKVTTVWKKERDVQ